MNRGSQNHPLMTIVATIVITAALASSARAATYYVSTTGNDSTGTGTSLKPWKTIEKSITKAKAGDTVSIAAGNYTYETTPIAFTASGTSTSPITFKSSGGVACFFAPMSATSQSYITLKGLQVQNYGSYDGFKFTSCNNMTLDTASAYNLWSGYGIDLQGCSSITVTNCSVSSVSGGGIYCYSCSNVSILGNTIAEITGMGIYLLTSQSVTVDHCTINHTTESGIGVWGVPWGQNPAGSYPSSNIGITYCTLDRCCDGGYNECISIANGVLNAFVQHCLIHDSAPVNGANGGEGLDVKVAVWNIWLDHNEICNIQRTGVMVDAAVQYNPSWTPDGVHRVYFSDNKVHDVPGVGVMIEAEYYGAGINGLMDLVEVHDNLVYNNGSDGICVLNYNNANPVMTNIWICNNTVYNNCVSGGSCGISIYSNPNLDAPRVNNNIIDQASGWPIGASPISGFNWAWAYDNLVSGGGAWNWYANFQDVYHDWGNVYASDPLFVNAAAANFHLQGSSPARGVGAASGVPDGATASDFEGKPRPTSGGQGTGYDIGAYQY